MANHNWRIKRKYLSQLNSGEKQFEVRVGYNRILKVNIGDTITFNNEDIFEVLEIRKFKSFSQLMDSIPASSIVAGSNRNTALKALKSIYPPSKEKLGVYAFRLKKSTDSFRFIRLSELINQDNKEFSKVVNDCYMATDWISKDYPNHFEHFWTKYIPNIFIGERDVVACYSGCILAGLAILKKNKVESKISTLYVNNDFRNKGIATSLIEKSFDFLDTTKPLITISEYKLEMFSAIIKKYNWTLTQEVDGYYNDGVKELVYNGVLE